MKSGAACGKVPVPSLRKMLSVLVPASAMTTSGFLSLSTSAMAVHACAFAVELESGSLIRVGKVESPRPNRIVAVVGRPAALLPLR